jgi:hypothetical protein
MRPHVRWLLVLLVAGAVVACSDDNGKPATDAGADMTLQETAPDLKPAVDLPPPDANPALKPTIDQILPDNGFANATTHVVLIGTNFAQGARIYIDGSPITSYPAIASQVSLSFTMPKNPYGAPNYDKPQKVGVRVMSNSQFSNEVDFQYTVSLPMDAKFKGSVLTAKVDCYKDFSSDPFEATVFVEGITDTTTGEPAQLTSQIGFAAVGKDPTKDDGWKWAKGRFKQDDASGYDIYDGKLTVPLAQTYDVAFRFSQDGGKSWIYADMDETDLAYDPAKAAKVTATNAPPFYCQTDGDCKYAYAVVCKLDSVDKSKNVCVECLSNADCTGYAKSLGPQCDVTQNLCYCQDDTECASNPNGKVCLGYCGCNEDADCPSGTKCFADPATNMQTCQ